LLGKAFGRRFKKFQALSDHRRDLRLRRPITEPSLGRLTLAVKDRQGNVSRIERTFSVVPPAARR
jgi:hypothetical protein